MSHNVQCRTDDGPWVDMGDRTIHAGCEQFAADGGLQHGETMTVFARVAPDGQVFKRTVKAVTSYRVTDPRGGFKE